MIYINKNKLKMIYNLKLEDVLMTFDFDRTMTSVNSTTSWGVIDNSSLIPNLYKVDSTNLYNYYRMIEINEQIDKKIRDTMMTNWMMEQINLLYKYNIDELLFNQILDESQDLFFREGVVSFFDNLYQKNIPICIISAGLGNVIIKFLDKNNLLHENIYVLSNILKYKDDKIVINPIINSTNKSNIDMPCELNLLKETKNKLILFGDQISDLLIGNNFKGMESLNIGFLNDETSHYLELYKKHFDIVCTSDEGYNNIEKLLVKKDFNFDKKIYD